MHVADVLSRFNLRVGTFIGRWKIVGVSASSLAVTPSAEYHFPLRLTLACSTRTPEASAIGALAVYLQEPLVVYSAGGSPYLTHFHPPKIERGALQAETSGVRVEVSALGHSLRCISEPGI